MHKKSELIEYIEAFRDKCCATLHHMNEKVISDDDHNFKLKLRAEIGVLMGEVMERGANEFTAHIFSKILGRLIAHYGEQNVYAHAKAEIEAVQQRFTMNA